MNHGSGRGAVATTDHDHHVHSAPHTTADIDDGVSVESVAHQWGAGASIVIQAEVNMSNSSVLLKLEEFAQRCSRVVEGFSMQIGSRGVIFHNGENFQRYLLKEHEVPKIVKVVWDINLEGFFVRGFHLNGSTIQEAIMPKSKTLRTAGPALQVRGLLEELYVPTKGLNVGKSALICASRVVDIDGYLLTVRSRATFIVSPNEKFFKERLHGGKVQLFKMKMRSLLRFPRYQPKTAQRVTESEMLDFITRVVQQLLLLSKFTNQHLSQHTIPTSMLESSGDQHYWQRGLDDLNEVIRVNMNSSQCSLLFRIRARTGLFLGQFDSALQDFGLADNLYVGRPSSTDMLELAMVKVALGRYSEAMQDVMAAAAINSYRNDVKAVQTYLKQILHSKLQDGIHDIHPLISNDDDNIQEIPDLFTGEHWTTSITLENNCEKLWLFPSEAITTADQALAKCKIDGSGKV